MSIIQTNKENDALKDFGDESYWADFRSEVGVASLLGFPPDLESAAQGGNPQAQNNLGVLYYVGKNLKQDYKQAASWFKNGRLCLKKRL